MIRRLLFTIIWGYVFFFTTMLVWPLVAPLVVQRSADAEPTQQAIEAAARMAYGIPGVGGFLGAGLAILGLLPGTSFRKKVFRPSTRPLLRELDPGLFALRQFLDGYPFPAKPAAADGRSADLPRIALLTVGIISLLLGAAGLLCSIVALVRTTIPTAVNDATAFRIALYVMSLIIAAFCVGLLTCGLDFVQTNTRKVRPFGHLMMLELLCLALAGFLVRILIWLAPDVGPIIGSAIEAAKSGFMVQVVVLFPLWAPFLALWAMYQLDAQRAAEELAAGGRPARPPADKAQILKTLQAKYQVVRRMYEGFDYMPLLEASPAKQKAGVFAAMKFIRDQKDGESRYIQALTELSRAFDQAMPAYEAAVLQAEVTFFQAVRAGILKSKSAEEAAVEMPAEPPARAAAEMREFIPEAVILDQEPQPEILEPSTFLAPSDSAFDFHDALDADDPEVEALGQRVLHQINDELIAAIRRHVTADWSVRKGAKGEMRLLAKKILKSHGYPPARHEKVVQAVIQQAEEFCIELGGLGR